MLHCLNKDIQDNQEEIVKEEHERKEKEEKANKEKEEIVREKEKANVLITKEVLLQAPSPPIIQLDPSYDRGVFQDSRSNPLKPGGDDMIIDGATMKSFQSDSKHKKTQAMWDFPWLGLKRKEEKEGVLACSARYALPHHKATYQDVLMTSHQDEKPKVKGKHCFLFQEQKEEKIGKGRKVHDDWMQEQLQLGKPEKFKNKLWVVKDYKENEVIEIESPHSRRVRKVDRKQLMTWCDMNINHEDGT
ncbi:hypothetical protein LR48_Vigan02g091700 [Vigna angularis]|uniref:Uncharacterized protein n=1 Tax=Phaseolus angularis TaxID=3914 RepID=A0A0L9TWH7_PHAAN|nr:hypothetical protein LR48_Vigan02g091700 [Vigna angularis]